MLTFSHHYLSREVCSTPSKLVRVTVTIVVSSQSIFTHHWSLREPFGRIYGKCYGRHRSSGSSRTAAPLKLSAARMEDTIVLVPL